MNIENFIIRNKNNDCDLDITFDVEFESLEKLNSTDYGGQHYNILSKILFLNLNEDESELFIGFIRENLTAINAVAENEFDTKIIFKNGVMYLSIFFIDKDGYFDEDYEPVGDFDSPYAVLSDLISDAVNALIFAINEIGSYDDADEEGHITTSADLKDELIEKYSIEKGIKKESDDEVRLEEIILSEITNIDALDEKCIMHDINDEFEATIAEAFRIRFRSLELAE